MIVCTNCNLGRLKEDKAGLFCDNCGYVLESKNGVLSFIDWNEEDLYYDKEGIEFLKKFESDHFWFRLRKELILSKFLKYFAPDSKVLELGSGTGDIALSLKKLGYDVSIGEFHLNGLKYAAQNGIKKAYQLDILKNPFKNHFDVVGFFDVLSHIEDEKKAVKNIVDSVSIGGYVIGTFPAHQWLWYRGDRVINNHKKRYETEEIKGLFEDAGVKTIEAKTFFIGLLPILFIRSLLKKDDGSCVKEHEKKELNASINPIMNKIFYYFLKLELLLLKKFSFKIGGSILYIGQKI